MSEPAAPPERKLTLVEAFELAMTAAREGRAGEAEDLYRRLLAARPVPEASCNLGLLLETAERFDEAEATYRAGLEASPEDARLRRQLGALLLRLGRYPDAWPLLEARFELGPVRKPQLSFPEWTGQSIQSLLVIPEGGRAEQIRLARFAGLVGRRGRVTLACDPQLVRLFDPLGLGLLPVDRRFTAPRHDAWIMAGSLPLRLGTTVESVPSAPYLPRRVGGSGIGVLLRPTADGRAILPDEVVEALSGLPGARSLHPADTGARDLAETADLIDRLDLVIGADNEVAHLAGAMGKPCWLLLPHRADALWMHGRSDTPWYPAMRLFRQPAPNDWTRVVDEVRQALEERTS